MQLGADSFTKRKFQSGKWIGGWYDLVFGINKYASESKDLNRQICGHYKNKTSDIVPF